MVKKRIRNVIKQVFLSEEENQKPQPTEITIIEKRSLRTKVLLICGIVILSTALIGTFIYIGMQLYNLFA